MHSDSSSAAVGPGRRLVARARAAPVRTAVLVALATRVAFAIVSFVVNDAGLVPDERQYVGLAAAVSRGDGAESWFPGYGPSLYDTTWAFSAPLAHLYRVFGDVRLLGQLLAVVYGVLAVGLLTWLARRWLRPGPALAVGLLAALLPSQVLWSSIVLRESAVWASLVALACAVALWDGTPSRARLTGSLAAISVSLLALAHLRSQTMIAAAWTVMLVGIVLPGGRRWERLAGVAAIAVLVPAAAGFGLAGVDQVREAAPSLGQTRAERGFGARSSFTPTTIFRGSEPDAGSPGEDGAPVRPPLDEPNTVVDDSTGNIVVVDDSVAGNLRHIPRGFAGTMLRPWPFESTEGVGPALARVENLAWYGLYALGLLGLWSSRRRWRLTLFPMLLSVAVLGVSFLAEGNVGTAFRHRGQMLWAIALAAGFGLQAVLDRRERTASTVALCPGPSAESSRLVSLP